MSKTYSIEVVREKFNIKTFILGSIPMPIKEIEKVINEKTAQGYQFESIAVETSRSFLFWMRESAVLVFSK